MTTDALRERAAALFTDIDALPEPDRSALLQSIRGTAAGKITTAARTQANRAPRSAETRAKMAAAARRREARKRAGESD